MSGLPDKSFSETEKVVLLAEIIKSSHIPSAALLHLIIAYQVEPEWTEIQRPPGRLLRDCQRAFSDLRNAPGPSPYPLQDARVSETSALPQYPPRTPYAEAGSTIGRALVPRPQGLPPGVYPGPGHFMQPQAAEPPRKRGRPSNADLEARRQRAEALGEQYPASSRARQRGKTASRLSIPPSTPATPTQSEPGTATSAPITSPKSKAPLALARKEASSASPAPIGGESSKRPLPTDAPAEEGQPDPLDHRRPPERGPRFHASADVVPQPWSATPAPTGSVYPQRSLPPPGPMPPLAAAAPPHLDKHHHLHIHPGGSRPSTPQRRSSPPQQPSSH